MPPVRNISDFFKPYIKPKRKVIDDNDVFDNITVLAPSDDRPMGATVSRARDTESLPASFGNTGARQQVKPRPVSKTVSRQEVEPRPVPKTVSRQELEPSSISKVISRQEIGSTLTFKAAVSRDEIEPTPVSNNVSREQVEPAPIPKTVSFSSALTSLSPTPTPPEAAIQYDPRRVMRQLSPLSLRSSSSSSPSPPPLRSRYAVPNPPPANRASNDALPSSALSAPPISSQSSSRRVVRGGQLAVTNSDSDSVDQDDDPLDDIEELIRRKRMSMGTAALHVASIPAPDDPQSRPLRSSMKKSYTATRKPGPPPKKKYRFDLASLARQSKVEAAWTEKQKEYAYLEAINEEPDARPKDPQQGLDRIADQLRGEHGDAQEKGEIVRAMKRIDALQDDIQYHFFNPTTHQPRQKFPTDSLKDSKTWAKIMNNQSSREQAFVTGFVADLMRIASLPDAIIEWLLQDLIYEARHHLSMAYVSVLQIHFKTHHASLDLLRETFLTLAGREDFTSGVDIRAPVSPESPNTRRNPKSLCAARCCSILVGKVCETLPVAEQRRWLHILMLVLLDKGVQEDMSTKLEVQCSLNSLMAATTPDRLDDTCRNLGINILTSTNNPILLHRLLCALPSTEPHLHTFKRRLALAAVMKSEDYLTDSLNEPSLTYTIATHLRRNAKFKIREDTDFAALGARVGMLDIAVGAGFSDFAFVFDRPAALDAEGGGEASAARRRGPQSAAEKAFDEAIDALVGELRVVARNIRDAGAAHMQRTECKGILEKLSYRLEFAARTRPKPKRSIFGVGAMNANVVDMFTRGGAMQ